jgi:hypothetical protein
MSEERAKILNMLADGKINAEQASQLLSALGGAPDGAASEEAVLRPGQAASTGASTPPDLTPHFGSLWLIPMYVGLVLFVCGALAAFPLYAGGAGWVFAVCGWPVFVIGLLTMIGAWLSSRSRWIHVRITNVDGSKRSIKFSFPIPLRLSAWALKTGSRFIPKLKDTGVDEMIAALDEGMTGDQPLVVDVQEDDDGERVQVYIG